MLTRFLLQVSWSDTLPVTKLKGLVVQAGPAPISNMARYELWMTARAASLPLPRERGHIIGTLFPRHGPATPVGSETHHWSDDLAGPHPLMMLRDRYWGGYVALMESEDGVTVARDPSGAMPCYFVRLPWGCVFASDADLLVEAGLVKPVVNWSQLPRYLAAKELPSPLTAIEALEELLPGSAIHMSQAGQSVEPFWSPWDYVVPAERWDHEGAADRLRRLVDHCVASWASTASRITATLSGGLDSSIVAAALARSQSQFECATLATSDRMGDEREYARAMAQAIGAPLHEAFYDMHDIDLSMSVARHFPKPVGRIHELAYHRAMMRIAQDGGADAVFTGNGGDNLFYNTKSVRPFFDCLRQGGGLANAFRTFCNIAEVVGVSRRTAALEIGRAIGTMNKPYKWRPNLTMLAADVAADMMRCPLDHEWLHGPGKPVPGKIGHISYLLRSHNHLEGYFRPYDMPLINPLMSQPLMEWMLAVPTWVMLDGGRDRALARKAYGDILPPIIADRRIKGSPGGFAISALRHHAAEARTRLLEGELSRRQLIDRYAVEAALGRVEGIEEHYVRLLDLLDMEAWIGNWQAKLS
ncbi:asparagine synthetase B family protein [Sphingobium yanoikuyae]|uniref:asparagine synthase (glutamine-hydrolyzing) n=2 Tax=Sphingobium yanoikuyae TaxID=13690 RepID=A0A430BQA2_SPHYA|nr:asparagine synthetase B family protein [Sphingobium yanoikuyae]